MRTLIKLFTTIFALVLLFSCYRKEDSSLFVIEKDGRYGYVNAKGDTIIDCAHKPDGAQQAAHAEPRLQRTFRIKQLNEQ